LFFALLLQGLSGPVAHAAGGRVWVNTNSGVYHCPGTRYYGNTRRGEFLEESVATSQGYRPAHGAPCSRASTEAGRSSALQSAAPAALDASNRVWINTGSHVYHCPGTRYYGNTKSGRFASEAEAIATGNRPAYGVRCH
jgi:hypothetical protein